MQCIRYATFVLFLPVCCELNIASAADVTYEVVFEGTWSADTHPEAFPGSAHFSDLVGATHSADAVFWESGGLASPGIELMAETGLTSTLRSEVQTAINSGTAKEVIDGPDLFFLPNSTSLNISVNEANPLVTLVTMIAPSPDWFIGVTGLSLRENGQWLGQVEVDLYAYDAGTEEGNSFSLGNPATSPQGTIEKITTGPLGSLPKLGKFTFTVQPNGLTGDFNLDGQVDAADADILSENFGNYSDGSAQVVHGDADADGDVDGHDYLLWQRNYNEALPGLSSINQVPEPGAVCLVLLGLAGLFTTRSHRL